MKQEDLERYHQGVKIRSKIDKYKSTLHELEKCDKVKIFGNDSQSNKSRIDIDFQNGHPFYPVVKDFIEQYKKWIIFQIKTLEIEFNEI